MKIIEMILTHQPVAALTVREPDWLIVVAVHRSSHQHPRPWRNRQMCADECAGLRATTSPRVESSFWRSASPSRLIGNDAAAAKRHRNRHSPAASQPGGNFGRAANPYCRERCGAEVFL